MHTRTPDSDIQDWNSMISLLWRLRDVRYLSDILGEPVWFIYGGL